LTLSGISTAVLGWIGYFKLTPFWQDFLYGKEVQRPMALFKDPNVFGAFFVPLAIWLFYEIIKPTLWKNWKIAKIFLFFLFLFTIIFSGSRGAWLNLGAAMISFILIFLYHLRITMSSKLKFISFLIIVLLLAITLSFYFGFSYLQSREGFHRYDITRFEKQKEALELSGESLLGIGPGQAEEIIQYATHSLYLRVLLENGWFSFFCFIFFLLYFGWKTFTFSLVKNPKYGISPLVIFSSFLGILANSFFIDTLHWRHFWLILGIGTALIYEENKKQKA